MKDEFEYTMIFLLGGGVFWLLALGVNALSQWIGGLLLCL